MGDRLGIPGAVSFCFSFTGQLTHFSKLQHSCVLLYPFNLIAASFCLLTSLWLLSAFGVTKDSSASSFFISPPGGDRQAFLSTTWEMYPLRFQVQISRIQRQNKFSSSRFLMLVTGQKLLASEQIKYSAFSRTLLVLGNRTRDSSAQKNQWNNHKGKSKYLFIYLFIIYLLFIIYYYLLFIIYYSFRHGLSVFFIIQN